MFPLSSMRRRERERLPIAVSLARQRYCIPPGQWPLPDKPLWLLLRWGEGTTARVGGESQASKGGRMQTSCTGKIGLSIITRVPQTHAKGDTAPGLQRSYSLLAEGFILASSHWNTPKYKAARYINGTQSDNDVCYPPSLGWGHWGYLHGHGDCLGGESGPWEPPHGSHPLRTYSGGTGRRRFGRRPPLNV